MEVVSFGREYAGRNLPHGVYVDNIGLNGLLLLDNMNERTFYLTAAKWVPETTRLFHIQAAQEGKQTSIPVLLHVKHKREAGFEISIMSCHYRFEAVQDREGFEVKSGMGACG